MKIELPDNATNKDLLKLLYGEPDKEMSDSVLYKFKWGKIKRKYFWTHFSKEWLDLPLEPKKEDNKVKWQYEVSLEIPNIQESGSTFSRLEITYDEKEAFALLADGRNRLERIGKINGKIVTQMYNWGDNKWY